MQELPADRAPIYRAFISYSHRDKAWGDWLHRSLETWRVPPRLVGMSTEAGTIPRRLIPIFRDREELASATDLGRKVNEALAQSANLLVICSPASAASRWVNEEVLAWKRMGRGERIFCLIVGGEPNATGMPGREAEECFCPALRHALDAQGQPVGEPVEVIAADAREGKDGKANAKLKLIAGMLGVGYDALKQREQHRKLRRMAVVTALALVVMAITAVLAVFALIARQQAVAAERAARAAQHQAVVAREAAERRQKQAEGLVNFMLGDLNDKLQDVSRLDIMQAVDDKAMAYFHSLPDTDVTDAALAQRAKALEKIGSVRMQQGQLPGALAAYLASTKISSRLAAQAPMDVTRQVAYSRTLAFIGLAYWQQGKLDAAQQAFEQGRKVLTTSVAQAKHDPALLNQLQMLDNNIGHVQEARGQVDAAESAYRDTLALAKRLVQLKPGDSHYLSTLGDAYNNLGKLALGRGDLATAIARYRSDDAIQARLVAQNRRDNGQRMTWLEVHAILGRTLALVGDTRNGMRDMQQAVDAAEQLARIEPAQTDYQDDLALYSTQLARLERLSGDTAAARRLVERAAGILATLTSKDPSNSYWQGDLAAALTEQAAQSNAVGRTHDARAQVQQALRILEPMLAKQPDQRDTLLATMTARLLLADVDANSEDARSLRQAALATMQAQHAGKDDPRLLALQVEALLALGRAGEAQLLVKRLWTSGYRDLALLDALHREGIDYPPNPDFQKRLLAASTQALDGLPPTVNEAHQ